MEKVMPHHRFEFNEQCRSCKGTGLYVGMAERHGSAVVCVDCKGSGCCHRIVEYDDFEGRQERPEIQRVFQANPGIGIGRDLTRHLDLADFGGQPYEDWKQGKPFPNGSEMRRFVCPAWWYQVTDYFLKPDWEECGLGAFSQCPFFAKKEGCWRRFDEEHPELAPEAKQE